MTNNPAEFRTTVKRVFLKILERYSFYETSDDPTTKENEYFIEFYNQHLRIRVEGIHWGTAISVSIAKNVPSKKFYDISFYYTYKAFLTLTPAGQILQLLKVVKNLDTIGEEIFIGKSSFFEHMEALYEDFEVEKTELQKLQEQAMVDQGYNFTNTEFGIIYQTEDTTLTPEKALADTNTTPIFLNLDEYSKEDPTSQPIILKRWYKNVKDEIKMGEPILEIETEKVIMDIESKIDGILISKLVEGSVIDHTTVLGVILMTGNSSLH